MRLGYTLNITEIYFEIVVDDLENLELLAVILVNETLSYNFDSFLEKGEQTVIVVIWNVSLSFL